jgi:tetratricopeptide (TPR) repeat protein
MRSCAPALTRRCALALLSAACSFAAPPALRAQSPPPRPDLESLAVATVPRAPAADRDQILDRAMAARDWPRAERLLVDALERQPRSTTLLKTLAGVFLMDRKPLNAAIALKKAEAIEPLDPPARFLLVLAYVAMARGDWARPELERLALAQPAAALYPYWLGRLDYDAGQYASAIRRFEAAIALDATFVRGFDNLGLCHEALNQPEQAIARYREAVRLNRLGGEPSPWPPLNLGILLRTRGATDEAEGLFRESLAADPGFARAHYQLAAVLEDANRTDEALQSLERAARADPAYPEPHYALSRLYRRQGRAEQADAELRLFQRLRTPPRDAAAGPAPPKDEQP